jgi:predicted hydrocarbon binding protein
MPSPVDVKSSQLVAFPRPSLAALRGALLRETGAAFAPVLQEAGYAGGESVFEAFRGWLRSGGLPDADALSVRDYQTHAATFLSDAGWGSIAITDLDGVAAIVDSLDWAEADPSSAMPYPACHYTTGLFADLFGRTAAAPLAVLEVECRSSGSHRCRFLVGSAEVMGHLYERMTAGVGYEAAAGELR